MLADNEISSFVLLFVFSVAATIKDLRSHSLPFMLNIVRHFTLVTVAQQAGIYTNK